MGKSRAIKYVIAPIYMIYMPELSLYGKEKIKYSTINICVCIPWKRERHMGFESKYRKHSKLKTISFVKANEE